MGCIVDIAEFKRLLRIGHGRAIMFLWDTEDDTSYRDAILEACIHTQAVDPTVDTRGNYMRDAIIATGNPEWYEPQIIAALLSLSDSANEYDVQQLYHLVWLLTFDGNTQAREAIYQRAATNIAQAGFAGAYQVVRMDGMDGYGFAAEHIGRYLLTGGALDGEYDQFKIDNHLIELLEARYGQMDYLTMLAKAGEGNAGVITYVETVLALRNCLPGRRSRLDNPRGWNYVRLQDAYQRGLHSPRLTFRAWGRQCTEADLLLAATDLVTQTDSAQLEAYLSIFHQRPFPFEPSQLIPFTLHASERVKGAAFSALEQIVHPAVRALALDLIQAGIDMDYAVGLLGANFQLGDWKLIERLTTQPFAKLADHHLFQIQVKQIAKAQLGPESVGALLNLYEFGPCAYCRQQVVNLLMTNDALSTAMREECEYDSDLDTQRLILGDADDPN